MKKLLDLFAEETYGFNIKWILAQFLMGFFPIFVGNRTRTMIMRVMGFKIGKRTNFFGPPVFSGGRKPQQRFVIGEDCIVSIECHFDLAAPIIIGNRVGIGSRSTFITGSHRIGSSYSRMGALTPRQINICDGAWLGANVLVLPGVTIGPGAVVAAGSVVTKDVPQNTLAAGVPAVIKRELAEGEA